MRITREVMGMPVTVALVHPGLEGPGAVEAIFADLHLIDGIFSTFKPESDISRINRGELAPALAHPLVSEVLDLCRRWELRTSGHFSAWRSGRLDPSGLVKGWVLERARSILDGAGVHDYFVDGSGDVYTRGRSFSGRPWRIGIRHPVEREKVVRVVLGEDLAVATSGTYEKGPHIYDPGTGQPVRSDYLSLTVIGPRILDADVYATAAFAMGSSGLPFIARIDGFEGYAIDRHLQATMTPGFPAPAE